MARKNGTTFQATSSFIAFKEEFMQVIPVIDLKGGAVVRARRGERDAYAPIETPLAETSAPVDVVGGYFKIHHFTTIYIADLDAIRSRSADERSLAALSSAFPETRFWIDPGIRNVDEARAWLIRHPRQDLVLGSETLQSLAPLEELEKERLILSLDFRGETFLGPTTILDAPHLWPAQVIMMDLLRVGAGEGPDLERIAALRARAPEVGLFAAGGLCGARDLRRLAAAGASGVLVASALHDGRLAAADLDSIRDCLDSS